MAQPVRAHCGTVEARTPYISRFLVGTRRDSDAPRSGFDNTLGHYARLAGIVAFRFDSRWRYQKKPIFIDFLTTPVHLWHRCGTYNHLQRASEDGQR